MAGGGPAPAAGRLRQDGGRALKVVVRLAAALRPHADGASSVEVDVERPATVGSVLDAVANAHPAVGRRVRDEAGRLRRHVNVFVGDDNARSLDDAETVVPEGVDVTVMPAISGGCWQPPSALTDEFRSAPTSFLPNE